jgi:hypothetical protein
MRVESEAASEEETPGWISMVDSLMLTSVLLFGLVLLAGDRVVEHRELTQLRIEKSLFDTEAGRSAKLEKENEELRKRLLDANQVSARAEDFESVLERLCILDSNLAESDFRRQELESMVGFLSDVNQRLIEYAFEVGRDRDMLGSLTIDLEQKVTALEARVVELEDAEEKFLKLASDFERARQDLSVLQGRLEERERLVTELREQLKRKAGELTEQTRKTAVAEAIIRDRADRILRPLTSALLVVRIRASNVRDDLDLDLYVQAPNDRLCNWKNPRVENGNAEVATLIPSEHLLTLEANSETGDTVTLTEEAYYSTEFAVSKSTNPYLVFCMLREAGEKPTGGDVAQAVDWEVIVNQPGQDPRRLTGRSSVRQSGRVMVQKSGEVYLGLVPLVGFYRDSADSVAPVAIPAPELPDVLRGWRRGKLQEGATPFIKFPDASIRSGG